MTITLDSVLTVAVGRNQANGKPLSDEAWTQFQTEVALELQLRGTVVGHGTGNGVGTDGLNDGQGEENAIWLALVEVHKLAPLRKALAAIIGRYGQSTAAFSYDLAHEPVFSSTTDGFRPSLVTEDFLQDGRSRRTTPR
jgi:hypothetical protein